MDKVSEIRRKIDKIDAKIAKLLLEREREVLKLAQEKRDASLSIKDEEREAEILERLETPAQKEIFKKIIEKSQEIQRSEFDSKP